MTISALILFGAFLAAELILIFRGFFILSQLPLFHLPVFFFIFGIEILAGFLFYKNIAGILKKHRLFNLSVLLCSMYTPFFCILMSQEKVALGLSFSSPLPWYALTIYPLFIFLPIALSFVIFFNELLTKKLNIKFLFFGSALYFLIDIIVLWRFELLYSALVITALGFIVLCFTAYETLPKFKYGIIATALILLIFSSIPKNISCSIKSFVREFKTTLILNDITSYGELYIHKKRDTYIFSINHSRLFKYPDTHNTQEIVHTSLLQYPWAESILVIGGWNEIIEEVLRYPNIKNVYWANPVPDCFEKGWKILPAKFTYPEKLRILNNSDPRSFIKKLEKGKIFDIVIITLPDPTNIFFNRYYTNEFFKETSSVLSNNSMISIAIKTGEENLSRNRKFLSATAYNTLKKTFPNTLESYGKRIQILASHNRNFTTSHRALSEFLNALEDIPDYISPSLIKYKINSKEQVMKDLDINCVSINTDTKPASLKFALHELLYTFGALSGFFINLSESINSNFIYVILIVFILIFLKLFSKKTIETKLKITLPATGFVFAVFLYNATVSFHSGTGQIYRFIPLLLAGTAIGLIFSIILLENKNPAVFISAFRIFLTLSVLFLILLASVFEIMISPPSFICTFIFTFIGGFLFGSILYSGINSYLILANSSNEVLKLYTLILSGFLFACIGAVIMVPVMGIIDVLPALGILSLGCVTLISI